jgi:hypothetical protein
MSNGSIFAAQIAEFCAKAKGNADLVFRKIALEMFSRVILKTPVDTGRARANWLLGIGSIPAGTLEIDDKTGTATISRVTAESLGLKAGEVVYLVNNLEYATALEFGHSKQTPSGMVRTTILEFQGIVDQAASELPK